MMEDKDLHEAIDRIARTSDGRILYLFLQRKTMELAADLSDGALRVHTGERTFAAKLISLMASGIADSGGRSSDTSSSPGASAEQPIVFRLPERAAVSKPRPRGNARRVTASTRVAGYDGPDDAA